MKIIITEEYKGRLFSEYTIAPKDTTSEEIKKIKGWLKEKINRAKKYIDNLEQ